jgi:hypothetical protein
MGNRKRIGSYFCFCTNLARNRTAIRTQIRTRVDSPFPGPNMRPILVSTDTTLHKRDLSTLIVGTMAIRFINNCVIWLVDRAPEMLSSMSKDGLLEAAEWHVPLEDAAAMASSGIQLRLDSRNRKTNNNCVFKTVSSVKQNLAISHSCTFLR